MSTLKVNALRHNSASSDGVTLNSDGTAVMQVDGGMNFRNRIINGDIRIDQRNAGASVTSSTAGSHTYTIDRWFYLASPASKFTIQQNAGSVTPPTGFSNYFGVTSSSAYSIGASEYQIIGQKIEGFNFADLMWGTANAKTVTLSFWVRSSLTGSFGGFLRNGANNRFYVFSYTISSANTWEQKTVTIAGDTSGTWVGSTNGVGLDFNFNLAMGSVYNGTVGSWGSTVALGFSGAVSVVGTNGATWYITGVQLEVGSVATPFERRPYGAELELCRRYLQVFQGGSGSASSSTSWETIQQANPPFRATPALSLSGVAAIEDHAVTVYTQSSANVSLGSATALAFKYGLGNFSGLTNSRYYSLALAVNGNKLFAAAEL